MNIRYWPESHDFTEECNGETVHLRQVTSAPLITHNIYCEQPYNTSDGNRFLMLRTSDPDPTAPGSLLMYDIEKYRVMLLEDKVTSRGSHGLANAPWSGVCFTFKYLENETRLVRWNLDTLERIVMLFSTRIAPACRRFIWRACRRGFGKVWNKKFRIADSIFK